MKTVTLFRHAKSAGKDNPALADFDRPLAGRGQKAAPAMGAALRRHKIEPDLILCSPSGRTRQTLELAGPAAWDTGPETRFDERIYEASMATLLKLLHELPAKVRHAMMGA